MSIDDASLQNGPATFMRPTCTVGQVYPELLHALCALLDHALQGKIESGCWFGTFYRWFREDLDLWATERTTAHHLLAFGGMGSFNDLVYSRNFPGGEAGFDKFYQVYRLIKELSFACAEMWHEARRRFPDQVDRDILINYRGIPLTICTCSNGHRWMKEDLGMSFYASHAKTIAEMNAGFELVAQLGGKASMNWMFHHKLPFNSRPVLEAMRTAVDRIGLAPKPGNCTACNKKRISRELFYMIGWPMTVSPEFFQVDLA